MKSIVKLIVVSVVVLFFHTKTQAQGTTVRGYVYDLELQEPLIGATLITEDTTIATSTNIDGFFEIQTKDKQGKLRVSMIGYQTQFVEYNEGYSQLNIKLKTDVTLLNEVRITSYAGNKRSRETPGAIATISGKQLRQSGGSSIQNALNSVSGVRMDQSTLSESRISIRGNGIRSPWGIRNIKIYINDIPVTEADGTTRIEAIDVENLGSAEIVKGPASSIYGGGTTGGVINFKLQDANYQERSIEGAALIGSFGLQRYSTSYRHGDEKVNTYVSYGQQFFDGHREHAKDERQFMTGNFQFYPSEKQTITLLLSRSIQNSQIPGALNQKQVEENPNQASASNLDKQAGRYQKWTRIGIGQQYRFNPKLTNSTSIFTYFYDLNHPLAYAYIRNFYQSYGGRTRFTYDPKFEKLNTKFTLGAEFNQGNTKGAQYENVKGKEGNIRSNIDYINTYYTLFYQSETELTSKAVLTAGLSVNELSYDVKDYLSPEKNGIKRFNAQISPRVALSYNFGMPLSVHGTVSTGFAPPTTSEITDENGSINQSIRAEKAINYELNFKGNLLDSRFAYDLAFFKMDMEGELIAQTVQQNITIYNNSGRTEHNGIELALAYRIIDELNGKHLSLLRPYASITYSDFSFLDYKILDSTQEIVSQFDGNELTGIPPWVVSIGVDLETKIGFYFNANFYYNDKMPLNDANTTYNPSYNLLNTKLGYQKEFLKHFNLNVYAGLNNILDAKYSSFTSLNAVGFGGNQPAYFNPSPGINSYMGIALKYKL